MFYRLNTLKARSTYTSDTTIIEDINVKDPISQLIIGLEVTHAAATQTAHPVACITQIDIIDGSDVLFSLDGYEAEALDWYNNGGQFRSNYNYMMNGGTCSRYIGINFGRYLYDPELAFDPSKFTNPQIKISLDINGGGNSASTNYITIWAAIFDEKTINPRGFLMAKEIKVYTMASTVHEYTDLPTDYPYRAIYFRPFLLGTEPNACVSNIKISEDQDKRIPFDHGSQDILRTLCSMYPEVTETYFFALDTSTRYLYIASTTRVTAVSAVWAAAGVAQDAAFYNGDGGRLDTIATANASNTQIHVRGYVPHCVYELPCGMKNMIDDWYDVRSVGSLRADITGAAAATGYLFLQQFRPY